MSTAFMPGKRGESVGTWETYANNVVCRSKEDVQERFINGVSVGEMNLWLELHYQFHTEIMGNWEFHMKEIVLETYGFDLQMPEDVTAFLAFLENQGTTFQIWWNSFLERELLNFGVILGETE